MRLCRSPHCGLTLDQGPGPNPCRRSGQPISGAMPITTSNCMLLNAVNTQLLFGGSASYCRFLELLFRPDYSAHFNYSAPPFIPRLFSLQSLFVLASFPTCYRGCVEVMPTAPNEDLTEAIQPYSMHVRRLTVQVPNHVDLHQVSARYLDLTKRKLELSRLPRENPPPSHHLWCHGTPKSVLEPLLDFWY